MKRDARSLAANHSRDYRGRFIQVLEGNGIAIAGHCLKFCMINEYPGNAHIDHCSFDMLTIEFYTEF